MPESPAAPSASRILMKGLGVPLVAGALTVLGFAPFYAWLVPFATVAALFTVWLPEQRVIFHDEDSHRCDRTATRRQRVGRDHRAAGKHAGAILA